ncbi:hypothetical protein AB0L88_20015 [Saccharopolyspora shandongensis]|uniref:hypothetical protein n=1 Tax=Saccharopolyspora shandongensis TaxID=418495 RepID=UPI0034376FB5
MNLIEVWGADQVGVRVSPGGTFNDIPDDDPAETFHYVAEGEEARPPHRFSR